MGIPVETGDGRLQTGGVTTVVRAGFTRPADTTQYTAADIVSDSTAAGHPLVFRDCARFDGGTGIIYSAMLFISTDAATNPNFDLVLFDSAAITIAADNAAGTVTDAQALQCVAAITFDGTNSTNVATVGANLIVKATGLGQVFKCASGDRALYGIVVDRGAYTPASAEIITFKLGILQD